MIRILTGGIAVLAAAALNLHASQQTDRSSGQQPTFRSRVDLVQVDVVVVDEHGRHVRGLSADEFRILDQGRSRPIMAFEEVGREASSPSVYSETPAPVRRDVASNQVHRPDRLVVLVVDDLHIYRGRTEQARRIATEIVERLAPGAFMSVLFTSRDDSTEFTDDAALLAERVGAFRGRQGWRRPHAAVDRPMGPGGGRPVGFFYRSLGDNPAAMRREFDSVAPPTLYEFFDNMAAYKVLEDAAKTLASSPAQRKSFILISEGIGLDLTGVFDEPPRPCGGCYHDHALQNMMRAMHRANVTTYAIDPRGHVSSRDLLRESFPAPSGIAVHAGGSQDDEDSPLRSLNPVRQAQNGLRHLAETSGGFAVTNTDDLTSGLSRIIDDLDHYYLIGFTPDGDGGKDYRRLRVTVSRPGATVRFRRGYTADRGSPRQETADPLARLASSVAPSGALPMRMQTIPLPQAGRDTRVAVALELTLPARPDSGPIDDLRYSVFAIDVKKWRLRQQAGGTATVAPTPPGQAHAATYQILSSVMLPPGSYQIRATAESAALGTGGSVFQLVTVPSNGRQPFLLSDLVLGYATGAPVPGVRDGTMAAALLPFDPTLDRTFARADVLRVFAHLTRRRPDPITARVLLAGDAGEPVWGIDIPVAAGTRAIDVQVPLAGVAPGVYRLQVTASSGAHSVTRDAEIVVR